MRALLLVFVLSSGPALADKLSVAVSYFDNNSGQASLDPLARGLADMLITDLSNVEALQLVEREKLNLALDELKLSKTKFIDPKNALKLGKGLSARYLLTGGYAVVGEVMRVDARLFDVPAGKVLFSEKVEGKKDEFFALEKELVDLLIKALDLKLPLAEKSKLRSNATESFDAFSVYSSALAAKDSGDEAKAQELFEAALSADPNYRAAKNAAERLRAIAKKVDDRQVAQADDLRKQLDPKAKDFAERVAQLVRSLDSTKTDQLKRKIDLLVYLAENDLTPMSGPGFSVVALAGLELIGRMEDDPVSWPHILPACEYLVMKFPTHAGITDRCRLTERSMKYNRETPVAEAQAKWDEEKAEELRLDPDDWRVALRKNEAGLRKLVATYAAKGKKK